MTHVTNPFEDDEARFLVLVNGAGQHSLWPAFADVPDGWIVARPEETRQVCLEYIDKVWTDMRPRGLVEATDGGR
ncbi:MbtH family protein [Streptomyces sp. DT224]|uniref:MbtH family protein n=1 Tax=Streptomyces sp. DT224 TaxID=3393426 RepID=UPI003CF15CFC